MKTKTSFVERDAYVESLVVKTNAWGYFPPCMAGEILKRGQTSNCVYVSLTQNRCAHTLSCIFLFSDIVI